MITPPTPPPLYVPSRLQPVRRKTRVVRVGDVAVGGDEPIRVQSMTTTSTWDVEGTLGQMERLQAAGCEIVRVTVPTQKDADALPAIMAGMKARGLRMPVVADIHFSPKMAMLAAEHVDKVRINPGNFVDGQKFFAVTSYSDAEYDEELRRIEERFTPLVERCKQRGIAMRIGTNHGSLSDRIVNRYGDSPEGMVESALEFVKICERLDYRELIISMKASNTRVMLEAYRLLAARMDELGMDYPFHLGVTEAGDGDDARIKSGAGIGGLLQDGIGDTIRVSLTEDPVNEVPVGFSLARRAGPRLATQAVSLDLPAAEPGASPYTFKRRAARRVEQGGAATAMGGDQPLRVEHALGRAGLLGAPRALDVARALACAGDRRLELLSLEVGDATDVAIVEAVRAGTEPLEPPLALEARVRAAVRQDASLLARVVRAVDRVTPLDGVALADVPALAAALAAAPDADERALCFEAESATAQAALRDVPDLVAAARAAGAQHVAVTLRQSIGGEPLTPIARALVAALDARGLDAPLVLSVQCRGPDGLVDAATDAGGLLVDGLGDALRLEGLADARRAIDLSYGILQGTRRRTTKTEYISCPGCGRTLFELEPVTAKIKSRTSHLKGVKIAVMGCVVNGPGEMADADFGYVGWKPGKVNLYVSKECVVRDVPEDEAPDRLVDLIRAHGRWIDPPLTEGAAVPMTVSADA
jgi:(E)-4-hydroxy-3-methylbut-2-enyl-diphosphate synthase